MSLRHAAALHVVPLLARLTIAAIVVPLGWTDLTVKTTFSGDDASRLVELGIASGASAQPARWAFRTSEPPDSAAASLNDQSAAEVAAPTAGASQVEGSRGSTLVGEPAAISPSPTPDAAVTTSIEALGLHRWTLLFADAGAPAPVALAWLAALLGLIGGSLLALGLVTRAWAVLFAAFFGSIVWLLGAPQLSPQFLFGADLDAVQGVAAGLGMFVLCLGLVLTGGGNVSLDRAIFRPRPVHAAIAARPSATAAPATRSALAPSPTSVLGTSTGPGSISSSVAPPPGTASPAATKTHP